jgi:CCR4-NOT transcription complex subunit 6
MSLHGEYDSLFYPKSRARTMDEYSRKAVDGCATFWKTNKYNLSTNNGRFSLVEKHLIEFQQIAMQRPELRKTEDVYNRVMIKDNIAVLTLLESKDTHAARIIVANAHLHWDPNYKDVKLVQTAMLVEELGQMANTWSGLSSRHPTHAVYAANPLKLPVIIAGDFNSMPSSGVYEFLSTGVIRQDHDDFGTYKYGKYTTDGLYCRTAFKSAYSHIQEEPHEGGGGDGSELPPGAIMWTNYTPGFRGVIDYVWYGTAGVSVTGVLAGVDRGYAEGVVGFPNWHHPSDHIPLVVGFRIKSVL